MATIKEATDKYINKIGHVDIELILADSLKKTREFVLSHPEYELSKSQLKNFESKISRRSKGEPVAYLAGHKEFYGLDFLVNKHTLVPRPETEQIVELVLDDLQDTRYKIQDTNIIDVGTGSGCIAISIAHESKDKAQIFATDISEGALKIARKNARLNGVDKKIKFMHNSLLDPFIQNSNFKINNSTMIIVANLPYLSKEIYQSAPIDVKKFEPKSALYSAKAGLAHYEKLLKQIGAISKNYKLKAISCFLEISPEQKISITKMIRSILPKSKISFSKDLAGKWRVCKISIKK